jgi:hypothetical protein
MKLEIDMHKVGSIATITWHPAQFDFIGIDVEILSEPYKILSVLSKKDIEKSQPGWLSYLELDFQTVVFPITSTVFHYPSRWMLQKTIYLDNPYKNKKLL